jgi:hypothetical protein
MLENNLDTRSKPQAMLDMYFLEIDSNIILPNHERL